MEVWKIISFQNGWFVGSTLIFQGVCKMSAFRFFVSFGWKGTDLREIEDPNIHMAEALKVRRNYVFEITFKFIPVAKMSCITILFSNI